MPQQQQQQQKALFLEKPHGKWYVGERPVPTVKPGELLIKIQSAGLNPVDWKIREHGIFVQEWPAVLGTDSAGIVDGIGEGVVTRGFEKGDRVLHQGHIENDYGTFQQYTVCPADVVAKIPPRMSFDHAATLPVALATALIGLYLHRREFGVDPLIPPWFPGGYKLYKDKTLVVLGGATNVGRCVIQFAFLSGFSRIVATASQRNKEAVLHIGATHFVEKTQPPEAILVALGGEPADIVFDCVSAPDTQNLGWSVTATGGTMTILLEKEIDPAQAPDKTLVHGVFGSSHNPQYRRDCAIMYSHLTPLLAAEDIEPNHVEVLPRGLHGIPDGLERMKEGKISMLKLIARPWETE